MTSSPINTDNPNSNNEELPPAQTSDQPEQAQHQEEQHLQEQQQSPPTKVRKTAKQPRKKASTGAGAAGSLTDLAAAASLFQDQATKLTFSPERDIESLFNPLSVSIIDPCGDGLAKREGSVMRERLLRRKGILERLTILSDALPSETITRTVITSPLLTTSSSSEQHTSVLSSPSASSTFGNSVETLSTTGANKGSEEGDEQGKKRKKKGTAAAAAATTITTETQGTTATGTQAPAEPKQKRCHEVPRDESGRPILPVTIFKGLIVNSLGEVNDSPSYQAKKYIIPVGFKSTRAYSSLTDMDKKATYVNEILDDGAGHPIFKVTCQEGDGRREPEVFQADTSSGVWAKIGKRINECKEAVIGKKNFTQLSGPEMFGYGHPTVIRLLQELPGVEKLTKYEMQSFEVKDIKGTQKKTQKSKQQQQQQQQQ